MEIPIIVCVWLVMPLVLRAPREESMVAVLVQMENLKLLLIHVYPLAQMDIIRMLMSVPYAMLHVRLVLLQEPVVV
jgi:hypothetical protein